MIKTLVHFNALLQIIVQYNKDRQSKGDLPFKSSGSFTYKLYANCM